MQQGSSSSGSISNQQPQVQPQPQTRVTATAVTPTSAVQVTQTYNAAPPNMAGAVFVLREIVALVFVLAWLGMLGYDIFVAPEEVVPFWLNMLGAGVLAFALGVNVENLTAFKGISVTATSTQR